MPKTIHQSQLTVHYDAARLYHSTASVWLSVDSLSDKYPSVSPYVYCANNPVRLVDPDGREWWVPEGATQPIYSKEITKENHPQGSTYLGETCFWQSVNLKNKTVYNCYGKEDGSVVKEKLDVKIIAQHNEFSVQKPAMEKNKLLQVNASDNTAYRTMAITTSICAALAADDLSGVGVIDDIVIPFVLLTGTTIVWYQEHTKNKNWQKHTAPRAGGDPETGRYGRNRNYQRGDKNKKYIPHPNPNKR